MTGAQVIVLATPVLLAAVALEYLIDRRCGGEGYRLNDALASIGLGMTHELASTLFKAMNFGIYVFVFQQVAVTRLDAGSPWVWIAALLLYDFHYYWFHRASHRVGLLWAAHVVHHQSECYNLSTAMRQPGTSWLVGWVFFLPMAVMGFPPLVFGWVAIIDLLYQFWVHTEHVGRLGWVDRWLCTPSNHRVHHAVNDGYIDRNYGGILILWDRLFGTFADERDDDPPVYGTRSPLRSFNPLRANLEVYVTLARQAWHAHDWRDRLRIWLAPPGWRPPGGDAREPERAFDIRETVRFDPPASPAARRAATVLFALALAASAWLLWNAHVVPRLELVAASLGILGTLVAVGSLCEGRLPREQEVRLGR